MPIRNQKASSHRALRIDDINVLPGRRDIDPRVVDNLIQSIRAVGLLSSITVRVANNPKRGGRRSYTLVAGHHRLKALRQMGQEIIDCIVVADDDLRAELAEIDENLCRAVLTPAQEAAAIARRKDIYLVLYPDTAAGKAQAKAMNAKVEGGNVSAESALTFTQTTAAASGKSRRSIEVAAARGRAIKPENLEKIAGTSLDKGTELDALSKMPEAERDALIARAARGESVSARHPLARHTRSNAPTLKNRSARRDKDRLARRDEPTVAPRRIRR